MPAAENGCQNGVTVDVEEVRNELERYGQQHLLNYWATLTNDKRKHLLHEITNLNLEAVCRYHKRCVHAAENVAKLDHQMEPLHSSLVGSVSRCDVTQFEHYESIG